MTMNRLDQARTPESRQKSSTHQTQEVQTAISVFCMFTAGNDLFVPMKLPLFNGDVNPDDVLPYNAASTDIQMTRYFYDVNK